MQTCNMNQELLTAYLANELPETQKREVHDHLATCPECRSRVEELRRVWKTAGSALSEPVGAFSDAHRLAVRAEIANKSKSRPKGFRAFLESGAFYHVAALFLLCTLIGFLMAQNQTLDKSKNALPSDRTDGAPLPLSFGSNQDFPADTKVRNVEYACDEIGFDEDVFPPKRDDAEEQMPFQRQQNETTKKESEAVKTAKKEAPRVEKQFTARRRAEKDTALPEAARHLKIMKKEKEIIQIESEERADALIPSVPLPSAAPDFPDASSDDDALWEEADGVTLISVEIAPKPSERAAEETSEKRKHSAEKELVQSEARGRAEAGIKHERILHETTPFPDAVGKSTPMNQITSERLTQIPISQNPALVQKLSLNRVTAQNIAAPSANSMLAIQSAFVKSPFRENTYVVYGEAVPNKNTLSDGNDVAVNFVMPEKQYPVYQLRNETTPWNQNAVFETEELPEIPVQMRVDIKGKRKPLIINVSREMLTEEFDKAPAQVRLAAVLHAAADPALLLDEQTRAAMIRTLEKLLETDYKGSESVRNLLNTLKKIK